MICLLNLLWMIKHKTEGSTPMAPALIEYGMALGVQKVINSLSGHHCAECGGGQHYPMKDRFAPELSRLSPAGEEK